MPAHPVWFSRLSFIVGELRALDADYLDRQTIERIFGIRQRRARQLMAGLPSVKVGNAVTVSRKDLINSLETASDSSKNSREGLAVCAVNRPATVSQKVPDGIRLYPGELRLRFTTPRTSPPSCRSYRLRSERRRWACRPPAPHRGRPPAPGPELPALPGRASACLPAFGRSGGVCGEPACDCTEVTVSYSPGPGGLP